MTFGAFLRRDRFAPALMVALALIVPNTPASAASSSASRSRSTRPAVTLAQAKPTSKSTATSKSTTAKRSYSATVAQARRARVAQARATARVRDWREVQTPRFTVDDAGQEVPDVRAAAAIIYNPETQQVLWQSNAQEERSIASITKVMTALVFLESGTPLDMPVTVQRSDVLRASTTYLRAGYQVTPDDLLHLLLIGSDNAAARALARVSVYGSEGFVAQMNAKASELGLGTTHYADPSGLLATNVSSAFDMARLITVAASDERIGSIMRLATYTVGSGKRTINVSSTNHLVREGEIDVRGGKTGFISRSGYCLATLLRLPQSSQQIAVVVLGAQSNAGRFWETRHLFNWMASHTQRLLNITATEQAQQQQH
jgi:serine-type D-Ala-D-Ala endopeptidase (penicillin-binding protein 7)